MQPTYMPWIGYFTMIHQADVFVFYDDVKFVKSSWQHRNFIKGEQGKQLLSVPTQKSQGGLIATTQLDDRGWRKKHLRTIQQAYRKAPYFEEVFSIISAVLNNESLQNLNSLNTELIRSFCTYLGIHTRFVFASDLHIAGSRVERLVTITSFFNGTTYLSPEGSWSYINADNRFKESSVSLRYLNYVDINYPQQHGAFIPYLSILDLLMNCGKQGLERVKHASGTPITHEEIKLRDH